MSSENNKQLFVPKGFAHGFQVLSETAIVNYKVDNFYNPKSDSGIIWNDKDLSIDWNLDIKPILSVKDLKLISFKEFKISFLMKVLVIGSDGQLGLEFQKISNSFDSLSWVFSTIKTLDLLSLDTINSFLNNINPTVIINCAAYTNVDKAETESKLANTINYKAVDIISKWTSENNKKLIHVSTDYVFDGLSNTSII